MSTRPRRLRAVPAITALMMVAITACVRGPDIRATLARAQQAETSILYAADGSQLATLHAEIDRRVVPLARIPREVRDAVIAIEDARFWLHDGIDYRSIMRALARDATEGEVLEGGSTITQQLVKNILTGAEPTLKRKIREALFARSLESLWTKEQILEGYLNTVYLGRGVYGFQAAAQMYFSKDVSSLTLPEGALLAGMIHAPSRFDPAADPAAARARRSVVLARMRQLGLIGVTAAGRAAAAPVALRPKPEIDRYQAPYFVEYVKEMLIDDGVTFAALGKTRAERINAVFKGGLRIQTTLDAGLQASAERAVNSTLSRASDPYAAFVGMDPSDGAVVSMVGGRDYFDAREPFGKFNLAVRSRRQPGSAFKPFTLIAALERGVSLERRYPAGSHIRLALPGGGTWDPHNYEGNSFGRSMTVRRATALSVNVVYAQLVLQIGAQSVVDVARKMGITSPLSAVPSIALGTLEVSPLELARAYATLANGGFRVDPMPVRSISDARGHLLWRARPTRTRVVSRIVAAQATDVLEDVMRVGTGAGLQTGFPVAGKTGTSDAYHDAWFAGFSPRYVGVTWVGFPRAQISMVPPRTRIRVYGSSWPGEIWRSWMIGAHRGKPAADFPALEDIIARVRVDRLRGCLPNAFTPFFVVEEQSFLRGKEPTAVCAEPRSANIASVPSVLGLRREPARREMLLAGLNVSVQRKYCPSFRPGEVCDQVPAAGSGARVGDTGVLYLSDDAALEEVPMALGRSLERARDVLERAGFTLAVERLQNSAAVSGCRDANVTAAERVWAQQPCAGERYGRGATVTIYIND